MSTKKFILAIFIPLIVIGICSLNISWAAESLPAPTMTDVALRDGGVLEGRIVDQQNIGRQGLQVTIRFQDHDVATTTTDASGRFVFQNLHGGVYQVVTPEGSEVFRLWAPRTAPPAAQDLAVVHLQNGFIVRNQANGGGGLKAFLGNPIVIPAVIATAVAVPIAVSSQHHTPASP